MFVGWEGVGLCSYLLIGFWYKNMYNANCGMKAFVVNRIGDFGVLIGMFMLFSYFGTLNFVEIFAKAPAVFSQAGALGAAGDRAVPVPRRDGQERAAAAAHLAARRHGRPDAGLRPDPRRDDGHRRRVHGGAHEPRVPAPRLPRASSWRWSAAPRRSWRRRSR